MNSTQNSGTGRQTQQKDTEDPQASERADLWKAYWATRDLSYRNQLILSYEPLVHAAATRLPSSVRSHWEMDDLKSFGILGLVEAIDRFDESSEPNRFPNYAMQRVRGAIYDELRRLDWLPRTIRRRVITYRATVDVLSTELGRVPEMDEILASMGAAANSTTNLLQDVQSSQLVQFQNHDESDDRSSAYRLIDRVVADGDGDPEPQLMAAERLSELRAAVQRLPERQRTIVTLHYLGGLTQEQIGDMLGVSNSRICQIEATAIKTLRGLLGDVDFDRPFTAKTG